jgi:hypothetical protein
MAQGREIPGIKAVKIHPLEWLLEPLESQPGYVRRKMFGCEAVYLNELLTLVLADGDEPWNGLLVATSREQHSALQKEWRKLKPHPVLGKWLYISQNDSAFEKTATAIVARVRRGDARIGVEPRPKKPKKKRAA